MIDPLIMCRFDGHAPAWAVYHMPKGCVCWPDPVQALCHQHAIKAESAGPIALVVPVNGFVLEDAPR